MKKNMTMISRLLAFSFLVLMGIVDALAYNPKAMPETSTTANPKYYLIMEVNHGFYVRHRGNGSDIYVDSTMPCCGILLPMAMA